MRILTAGAGQVCEGLLRLGVAHSDVRAVTPARECDAAHVPLRRQLRRRLPRRVDRRWAAQALPLTARQRAAGVAAEVAAGLRDAGAAVGAGLAPGGTVLHVAHLLVECPGRAALPVGAGFAAVLRVVRPWQHLCLRDVVPIEARGRGGMARVVAG